MSGTDLRRVIGTFACRTGRGQVRVPPRHFWFVSDAGLEAMAALFCTCERMCHWTQDQLFAELCGLPKSGGGTRLIALLNTLLRIWGRLRRPLSVQWELDHRHPSFWGGGAGRTSSDCTFQLNLATEAAHARKQHVITVLLDRFKCYETILWSMIMIEAREIGYPLRLMWMIL
eukprot:821697-Pyramimonas_sp.AAC.1